MGKFLLIQSFFALKKIKFILLNPSVTSILIGPLKFLKLCLTTLIFKMTVSFSLKSLTISRCFLIFKFEGKEYRKSKGLNIPSLCKLKIDFGPIPFKFSNFPNNGNKK